MLWGFFSVRSVWHLERQKKQKAGLGRFDVFEGKTGLFSAGRCGEKDIGGAVQGGFCWVLDHADDESGRHNLHGNVIWHPK